MTKKCDRMKCSGYVKQKIRTEPDVVKRLSLSRYKACSSVVFFGNDCNVGPSLQGTTSQIKHPTLPVFSPLHYYIEFPIWKHTFY